MSAVGIHWPDRLLLLLSPSGNVGCPDCQIDSIGFYLLLWDRGDRLWQFLNCIPGRWPRWIWLLLFSAIPTFFVPGIIILTISLVVRFSDAVCCCGGCCCCWSASSSSSSCDCLPLRIDPRAAGNLTKKSAKWWVDGTTAFGMFDRYNYYFIIAVEVFYCCVLRVFYWCDHVDGSAEVRIREERQDERHSRWICATITKLPDFATKPAMYANHKRPFSSDLLPFLAAASVLKGNSGITFHPYRLALHGCK